MPEGDIDSQAESNTVNPEVEEHASAVPVSIANIVMDSLMQHVDRTFHPEGFIHTIRQVHPHVK